MPVDSAAVIYSTELNTSLGYTFIGKPPVHSSFQNHARRGLRALLPHTVCYPANINASSPVLCVPYVEILAWLALTVTPFPGKNPESYPTYASRGRLDVHRGQAVRQIV